MKRTIIMTTLILACGCTGDADDDADRAWLVASVEQSSGNVVEFYEMSPGVIMVSEVGQGEPTLGPDELESMTTLAIFEAVAGDVEPPGELAAALDREQELAATGQEPERSGTRPDAEPFVPMAHDVPSASPQGSTGASGSSCSWSWFEASFCNTANDYEKCLKDRWYSRQDSFDNIKTHYTMICVKQGSPLFFISSKHDWAWWWTNEVYSVPAGYWRWWYHSDWFPHDVQSTVGLQGYTSSYHYMHRGNW